MFIVLTLWDALTAIQGFDLFFLTSGLILFIDSYYAKTIQLIDNANVINSIQYTRPVI